MDVIVTLEAVPALIRVPLKVEDKLAVSVGRLESLPLQGNPLDLVILGDEIFVAIDTFHAPGSTEAQHQGEVCFEAWRLRKLIRVNGYPGR